MGQSLVEIVNKGQDPLLEVLHREETATFEQAAHQDTEPDFDLIEPRGMFGGVDEADAMARVT